MSTSRQKITITFDELHTPAVEERLKQQSALDVAKSSSDRASTAPSPLPLPYDQPSGSIWYNTFFNLTVFGLLGGLLAWGCGELVQYFNPDVKSEARAIKRDMDEVSAAYAKGKIKSTARMMADLELVKEQGRGNAWFQFLIDEKMTPEQREARRQDLEERDRLRDLVADVCFYCACGTMIALALGMAESVASRNPQGAVTYGAVGALLGLIGGIIVSLFADRLYRLIGGGKPANELALGWQIFARATAWGVLGLFMSAAPGVVMRNWRKLILGLVGGLAGGVIGGALFDPVGRATGSPMVSRLIAIVAIGVITGVGTALVENAAKQGWLRVIKGLIAGKQFIVYRNPTFIGSSPQCEIYLFKDPHVGRRHAAMYVQPGGYEIEDLGTGYGTTINGRMVRRARLKSGDRVQIGDTTFTFQEKARN